MSVRRMHWSRSRGSRRVAGEGYATPFAAMRGVCAVIACAAIVVGSNRLQNVIAGTGQAWNAHLWDLN